MESKTKHRILGIVVVAGLAVLAYPLIQGNSSPTAEQAMVKAPPFPDQAIQVTSTDTDSVQPQSLTPDAPSPAISDSSSITVETPPAEPATNGVVNISTPSVNDLAATPAVQTDATPAANAAVESQAMAAAPAVDASPAVKDSAPATSAENNVATDAAAVPEEAALAPAAKKSAKKKIAKNKTAKLEQTLVNSKITSASAKAAYKHQPIDNNGLMQIKNAAWVIQLGSFKQKTNALKLVNKLRAKGYRAFIQHVNVASGENTRVFVGPEKQQASARVVASELANDMKLHGIVISYKPFTL